MIICFKKFKKYKNQIKKYISVYLLDLTKDQMTKNSRKKEKETLANFYPIPFHTLNVKCEMKWLVKI